MTRVHQVVVLAFIVFGVFTTATVSDSPTCKKGAQPVYQQQIIINSPDELSYPRATFDFTKVGEIVADELQNTTRWLAQIMEVESHLHAQMETNIAGKVHALSAELYAVKMQLDQITESVKELVELLPLDETSVYAKFEDDWFAQGVSRRAYKGTFHGSREVEGNRCVVKVYKEQWYERLGEEAYRADLRASYRAVEMANIFNRMHPTNKPITFVMPRISKISKCTSFNFLGFISIPKNVKGKLAGTQAPASEMIPKGATVAIEDYLEGEYVKFLSNSSYVNPDVAAFSPSAFSHFTFHESRGQILVCDLQGVRRSNGYLLTDPAVHSLRQGGGIGFYGPTDLGIFGMVKFFQNHQCNSICEWFVTPDVSNIPPDVAADVTRILQSIRIKGSSTFTYELDKSGLGRSRVQLVGKELASSMTVGLNRRPGGLSFSALQTQGAGALLRRGTILDKLKLIIAGIIIVVVQWLFQK